MEYPPLLELVKDKWPSDVLARAKELQEEIGSVGAYTHSKGIPLIRKHVAKFIAGSSMQDLITIDVLISASHRARWIPI